MTNPIKRTEFCSFFKFLMFFTQFGISLQELPDVPLFLSLHNLCATLKCTSPSAVIFRSAVINAGYRISGTHVNPLGLKSDAPMDVIWDIMRCWVRVAFCCSSISSVFTHTMNMGETIKLN